MKAGDRVVVIAPSDEYEGLTGTIVDLTPDGKVVVDIEMPGPKYRVPFDPHAIELEALARRSDHTDGLLEDR